MVVVLVFVGVSWRWWCVPFLSFRSCESKKKKEGRRKGQVRNVTNERVKERVDAKHAFDGNGVLLLHEACADRALHDRDCDQEVRDMW